MASAKFKLKVVGMYWVLQDFVNDKTASDVNDSEEDIGKM